MSVPSRTPRTAAPVFFAERAIVPIAVFVACSYAFEAPIRYFLSKLGLASLIYLRDLGLLVAVAIGFTGWMLGDRRKSPLVLTLLLLVFHFFVGSLFISSLFQRLFSFKQFLPFLLGLILAAHIRAKPRLAIWFATVLLLLTAVGVMVNYITPLPWEGEVVDTTFGSNAITRQWTAGQLTRISGFTRASFDAANIIMILLPIVLLWRKAWWERAIWIALSAVAIWFTTSKGPLLVLALIVGWLVLRSWFGVAAIRPAMLCCFVVMLALPLVALFAPPERVSLSGESAWWLSSFVVRMQDVWPQAFDIVRNEGSVLLGRGLGAIGTPAQYGEYWLANPGDNLFVYLFALMGPVCLIYLIYPLAKVVFGRAPDRSSSEFTELGAVLVMVWYAGGMTANMVEQPFLGIVIGVAYGLIAMSHPAVPNTAGDPLPSKFSLHAQGRVA